MGLIWTLLMATAMAEDIPAGEHVREGVVLQVPEHGLEDLADVVGTILPDLLAGEGLAIPDVDEGVSGFGIKLSDLALDLAVDDVEIDTSQGVLDINANLIVSVNNPNEKFDMEIEFFWVDSQCPGYVDPFGVTATIPITLQAIYSQDVDGRILDVSIGELGVATDLELGDVNLDCGYGTFLDVLDWLGLNLVDLVLGFAIGPIQDQLGGLEAELEGALSATRIEQELDVNGAIVDLLIEPEDVNIDANGLEIVLRSRFDAEQAACVAASDPGFSAGSGLTYPDLVDVPFSDSVRAVLTADMLNQAMYAFYRGGVLCYEVDESVLPAGLSLDSSFLGLLSSNAFDDIIPESQPIFIGTRPTSPPRIEPNGVDDLALRVDDLALDIHSELDGRMARVLTLDIDVDAGVNVALNSTTGELALDLDLAEALHISVGQDVLVVGSEAQIVDAVNGVVANLLDTLLGPVLADLTGFQLPAFSGLGLTALNIETTDAGVLAGIGLGAVDPNVYGGGAGCEDGCGGGCEGGGCAGTPVNGAMAVLLPIWLLRRRKD